MGKVSIVFCAFCFLMLKSGSCGPTKDGDWTKFKTINKKTFDKTRDELERKEIFVEHSKYIDEHNQKFKNGQVSFQLGVNKFADLNDTEFNIHAKGLLRRTSLPPADKEPFTKLRGPLPESIDYRELGLVGPVKNQGTCGSCYSFGAIGALEGQIYKKTGKMISLSEQNAVDCTTGTYGNHGCDGGIAQNVFRYVKANGIAKQDEYPYVDKKQMCQFKESMKVNMNVTGHINVARNDEAAVQRTLANVGPLTASIDASQKTFRFYKGGIYHEPKCKSGIMFMDHIVLLIGYGKNKEGDYWIIKNSWGPDWGLKGFGYVARNKGNHCGIATDVTYPLLE